MAQNHEPVTIATIKEVQNLFEPSPSKSSAAEKINLCRDALGKQKHHILTISEFRKYFSLL
jgi:hypothetical protein